MNTSAGTGILFALAGLGALAAHAQGPAPVARLAPDELPPAAKYAGPQDPDYVARTPRNTAPRQMEQLGRGVVAVNQGGGRVWVAWRLLGTEPEDIAFNVYRSTDGGAPVRLNAAPLREVTFLEDVAADLTKPNAYQVRPVLAGREGEPGRDFLNRLPANPAAGARLEIPLHPPQGGTWTPNDGSVGDLDGDGEYELVLKWEQRPRDTASAGLTGDSLLQGLRLDGTVLWTVHLGPNIREGAHYTQFMVYDLDGDGRAEVVAKTSDGTTDGAGRVLGDPAANWWSNGFVTAGPENLTVFDGLTGRALDTVPFLDRGDPREWGGIGGNGGNDAGTNRRDRFNAAVAYLDGVHPSLIWARGYYGKTLIGAWDLRGGRLARRWVFDSGSGIGGMNAFTGQGAHSVMVADVDADGRDEIVFHSMIVDDNGRGLYSTGFRHGDALHVGAFDPARPDDLEVFGVHESEIETSVYGSPGVAMFNGRDGRTLWRVLDGIDVGRGVAADIDPRHPGFEGWGGASGLRALTGERIGEAPRSQNFTIYWDGDPGVELLDGNLVDKWDWTAGTLTRLLTADGANSNNGSKATPVLSADLFGDWREELILRAADNHCLYVYTTTLPTDRRIFTLMHDPIYRLAVATQNVGYNQPPHTGFFLGFGTKFPVRRPNIVTVGR